VIARRAVLPLPITSGYAMTEPAAERAWVPLDARERRVLGVLVEKGKTTPDYYPLTLAALVTGCNQKSNRDPVTNYDEDDVEEILHGLRMKGAVILVEGSGRVVRWKHTLYDWLKVGKVELAIMGELLLRGSQTEGDLRARASRMEPLPDLATLQGHLEALASRDLVVFLSPRGQRRGVIVTHGLYRPEELERERTKHAAGPAETDVEPAPRPAVRPVTPGLAEEVASLRDELLALRARVEVLADEVRALKTELGA
jgi:uncharacterized protein YceH (UPF0502 family)